MATYHCELAWIGGDQAVADVVVETADGRITAVRTDTIDPPVGAVRLPGLTVPGFANAHSHAFHRLMRGRTQRGRGSFWTWREQMYEIAAGLDPDGYHRLARAVYAEMVVAGVTTVGEFHYLHHAADGRPYDDPNAMGAALAAAAGEAGLRLTLLDTCYLHGGIGVLPENTQRRFSDGDAESWAQRAAALRDGPGLRIGAAVHSVRAVDPDSIATVAEWAAARGVPLHAHVSEQPAENEQCRSAYGRTPVEVLAEHGALTDRFTAVHATHLTPGDVGLLGGHRARCCFCPTTERDLADGIGPAGDLTDAGARLTLGSDSHAVVDLFEEARSVELHERLATNVRGRFDPAALLTMATADGHDSLGWPDAGRIAVGARADLVTVDAGSVRTARLSDDPLGVAVFAASSADVRHVVVDGRVVVRDGHHLTVDPVAELRSWR